MKMSLSRFVFTCWIPFWLSCADNGVPPTLFPVAPVTAEVNQTLIIDFQVSNPSGSALIWSYDGPNLPGLDQTAVLIGTASNAQFRWTPLVSHVGTHQFDFRVNSANGSSQQSVLVDVRPGAGTAPIFVQPNNGGTYNVDIAPCVTFDVEVKDDDSPSVSIRASQPLPNGATLAPQSNQRARFQWCPTVVQINQSLTWTLRFEADDGEHPPTRHDYLVVFRRTVQDGCTGSPPNIDILEPSQDAVVTSSGGFDVVVRVTDDNEVRDAPVLYYTYNEPGSSSDDLSQFEAISFESENEVWRAEVPPSAANLEAFDVWFVVSATDNDDKTGTACDKRTDSPLRHFLAQIDSAPTPDCELCANSASCQSGVCSIAGLCIPACTDSCNCIEATTIDGGSLPTCDGPNACEDPAGTPLQCQPDPWSNSVQSVAMSMLGGNLSGSICGTSESDWYKFTSGLDKVLTWTLNDEDAADLDLELLDESGSSLILASTLSATETASICVAAGSVTYARVHMYQQSTAAGGSYQISAVQTDGTCCQNDENEPNNVLEDAIPAFDTVVGTLCPQDKDHYSFSVTEPSTAEIWVQSINSETIRFTVHGPLPTDTKMGSAYGGDGNAQWLGVLTKPGTYVVSISSLANTTIEYGGQITVDAQIDCFDTMGCPIDSVCYEEDGCLPATCASQLECPEVHSCQQNIAGNDSSKACMSWCSSDSSCRQSLGETCKRLGTNSRGCELAGSKTAGQSCDSHRDCSADLGCYDWPGGYCAVLGCTSNSDCPSGTICGGYGDMNRCLVTCGEPGQPACRASEGYACYLKLGVNGEFFSACVYDEDVFGT